MIADKIKKLRELSGLSQTQLAKKLNVTRSSVNAWELGISIPSTQYIVEVSLLFRVTTDYLLGIESESNLSLQGLREEEIKILYSLINYFQSDKEDKVDM